VPNLDRVERLPNASHWVHHDQAERVTQLLIDFFTPALPAENRIANDTTSNASVSGGDVDAARVGSGLVAAGHWFDRRRLPSGSMADARIPYGSSRGSDSSKRTSGPLRSMRTHAFCTASSASLSTEGSLFIRTPRSIGLTTPGPRGKYLLQMQTTSDSRRLLLDAAAHEFALFGPQGARIQAIVARAGVNERMIYHHFGSKEGLYRAVLEDQWLSLACGWAPILARAKALDPLGGLRLAFTGLLRLFLEHPLLPGLAFHESLTGWQAAPPARLASVPPELKRLFKQGQRSGLLRRDCEFTVLYLSLIYRATLHGITRAFRE
jgi:AcrR family transcriptional regulator